MDYEDELDRMRSRQQLKKRKNPQNKIIHNKDLEIFDLDEEDSTVFTKKNQGNKKAKNKKKRILILELIILFALMAGTYFYLKKPHMEGYWNIAVFGVDSRDGNLEKGALADVDMICSINRETGEIRLVSIYRDTYLKINSEGTYHKINEAYFKGGHTQAIAALNENLDLNLDDYATFNWKSVAEAINILGGIDLEISDSEFKYINAFITETVNSTGIASVHLEHAGSNHLDGVQAVAYARLRLMDTDYNRTARQRKVVSLALEKAKQADFSVIYNVIAVVMPQISTSISIDDMIPLAKNISNYHLGETGGFPFSRGETKIGKKDCVIPLTLESNVVQLHQFLFGTEDFIPSKTVQTISNQIAKDSGMEEVAENAPESHVGGNTGSTSSKPVETQPVPETASEEASIEETSVEETTIEEIEETTEETSSNSHGEIGPGVNLEPSSSSGNAINHAVAGQVKPSKEPQTSEAGPQTAESTEAAQTSTEYIKPDITSEQPGPGTP